MNRTTGYAVSALAQLAAHTGSEPLSNTLICERGGMPARFLLQILRTLVHAGLVVSTRGVAGGYKLARPADKITLLDVHEAIDAIPASSDLTIPGFSTGSQRSISAVLAGINDDTWKRLGSVTIADLKLAKG